MANQEINQLPAIAALALEDVFHVNDVSLSNTSNKATQQQGIDLINVSGLLETGSLLDGAITFPKIQDISTNSFLGRDTGGVGPVEELTAANARNILNVENGADVTDEANVKSALDGATISNVTVSGSDKVLIQDVSNSDNLRTVTAQSVADLAAGGGGTVTSVGSGTGLLGGPITGSGTLSVDVGTGAAQVPQNSDLGSASLADTGTGNTNVPTNNDLGTASLEPYESGTWTPVLEDFSANQATMAASTIGRYTRIGDNVTVYCQVRTTSLGSVSGSIRVSGLPFTALKLACSLAVSAGSGLALPTAGDSVEAFVDIDTATLTMGIWTSTTGSIDMDATEWTADGGCFFAGSYFIG